MSRAYTKQEAMERFVSQVGAIALYWARQENKTAQEKCSGTGFSILALLDGSNLGFPHFNVSLDPHEEDQAFHQEQGENWYEPGMIINDENELHQLYSDLGY